MKILEGYVLAMSARENARTAHLVEVKSFHRAKCGFLPALVGFGKWAKRWHGLDPDSYEDHWRAPTLCPKCFPKDRQPARIR